MTQSKFSVSKRKVVAAVAAVAAFAAVTVSAATLGGLQTSAVGANSNDVVAPVTQGVALSFATKYSATDKSYLVDGVTLAPLVSTEHIPAGATVQLTLTDEDGASLGEYVSTNGAVAWTLPTKAIPAHDVVGASVVINGGAVTATVTETR